MKKLAHDAGVVQDNHSPNIETDFSVLDYDKLQFIEVGNTGLNRWGGKVYEECLGQLQWPKAGKIYQEMSDNDATIGAIMYMTKQLIKDCSWKVEAASNSPQDKEAAEFLESCMHDMSSSWDETITEILSYLVYGWSFHEIVYKIRRGPTEKDGRYRSKYSDGRVGWRKIPIRSQHTLHEWIFDESDGGIIGMIQVAPPNYRQTIIPLSKGLLFRTESCRDNPEGRSLLRNAYRPWYFKKRIEEIEGIGIERDLAGLPVLTAPENVDIWSTDNPTAVAMRAQAESIVRSIRRDSNEGVVIPPGWKLELLSTGGSRQFDTNAIVNRYDQRIAITMLADIVMLGADKVGSFALADVKKSLLGTALDAQVWSIAEVFNKYAVPSLFEVNTFNVSELPRIVPSNINAPDIEKIGSYLQSVGLDISEDYELEMFLREIAGIPTQSAEDWKAKYEAKERKLREAEKQTNKDPKDDESKGDTSKEGGDDNGRQSNDS